MTARSISPTPDPSRVTSLAEGSSSETNVHTIAAGVFPAAERTDSPSPLIGPPAQKDNFEAKFQQAEGWLKSLTQATLNAYEKEMARGVFNEILKHLENASMSAKDFLMKARCEIGIAFSYPTGSERSKYANMGKTTNDWIYEALESEIQWKQLTNPEKIVIYQSLLDNYENGLIYVVPRIEVKAREEISDKIGKCQQKLRDLVALPSSPSPAESIAVPLAPPSIVPPAASEPSEAPKDPAPLDPPYVPPVEPVDAGKAPKQVTNGPVSGSRIRTIFGLAILSLATLFVGAVIYKRFVVKK